MRPSSREDVWARERETAKTSIEIRRLMTIDPDACRRARNCLGTAEGMLTDGLRLVACDFVKEGENFLRTVTRLAWAAFENNETYIYEDGTGSNHFANYIALRAAYLAAWAVGDTYSEAYDLMIDRLHAAIEQQQNVQAKGSCSPSGHLVLHLAEELRWADVKSILNQIPTTNDTRDLWCEVVRIMRDLAVTNSAVSNSSRNYDRWFHQRVDAERYGAPFDPALSWPDITCASRVRAQLLTPNVSPSSVLAAIRDPATAD
jgi:hypothetical protein